MDPRSLQFVIEACKGELQVGSPQTQVLRVCTDSRRVQAGDLFFALPGERFDGHDFLMEVKRKGAAAIVASRHKAPADLNGCPVILVEDTRKALGQLATEYRKQFTFPFVAVGGSNGKTTTKDLVASVLRKRATTLSSEGSFNNDIGVPLTLLGLDRSHRLAVVEVGTNHPGELAPLLAMIKPRYGVITNIGREHLEFFGDLQGVAREQSVLAQCLPQDGKLFLSGDNHWTHDLTAQTVAKIVRIGTSDGNDWRVSDVRTGKAGTAFRIESPIKEFTGDYRIHLVGRHQAVNALFAIALGVEFGLERPAIEKGLLDCKAPKMRLQLWEHNGVRVLDDAYNANADSMAAALETLKQLPCKGRRVAVLGDMAELGAHSQAAHEEAGRCAAEQGVGQLFAVGKMASVIARAARDAGLHRVLEFADVDTAAAALKSFLKSGDLLLLKASRAARLERISEMLRRDNGREKLA